ncbi:MAG TPA: beta-galactosidase [Methylomirabilota bacterium]|nr:beta-galactosidase [Methylomirabilota bacterium]
MRKIFTTASSFSQQNKRLASVLCFIIFSAFTSWSQEKTKPFENDLMYPPTEAAKPCIDYDGAGFTVNGQRTYLSSGSIHYPRVPQELWFDRLLRIKRGNFAAVQTYTFWNFHEPQENQFDFSGDKDFGKFLDTAQELGLYATVRIGPYVCAEWDSGGYPLWLKFKPSFKVRTDNPAWLAWNDHWCEKILPIVARHQVNHGGNVVMVQLENEHPLGWGVVTNSPYFEHLHDEAVKLGIEVPHFMSGLHHDHAPAPGNLDSSKRANPWFSTEFWVGWYNIYGALTDKRNREIETANWTILAHGGGGHNFYMLHGGTDFDSWNNEEMAASYDDGAPIGQAGDLRPMYYRMKRANQLAQSFPNILANDNDDLDDYKDFATGPGVKILGARKSQGGAGTFVFLQNSTMNETTATFKSGEQLTLKHSGIYPLPSDVVLADGIKIIDSTLPVLALTHNGQAVTVVIYGQPDETGRLSLSVNGGIKQGSPDSASENFTAGLPDKNHLDLKIKIPANGVAEFKVSQPDHLIRVLAINRDLSLYTWILGATNRQYVVCGPEFVQDVQETGGKISVIIERPYGQPSSGQVAVFGGRDQSWHLAAKADSSLDTKPAPELVDWEMAQTTEASPAFDDSRWKHSETLRQMGADGDISAFAWYRASVNVPSPTNGTLHFQGADNLEIFVNGQHVASQKGNAQAVFVAGTNSIAVFVSHRGRNKNWNFLGTLDNHDNKGLWGSATLEMDGSKSEITGWAMRGGVEADLAAIRKWSKPQDAKNAPAFYRATFTTTPPGKIGAHPILRVNYHGLSRGTMWINGHNLGRYPEKLKIDSLYVPECWLKDGKNVLTVFDETGASPAQLSLVVETAASREVIRVSEPIDPSTPMIIPQEN